MNVWIEEPVLAINFAHDRHAEFTRELNALFIGPAIEQHHELGRDVEPHEPILQKLAECGPKRLLEAQGRRHFDLTDVSSCPESEPNVDEVAFPFRLNIPLHEMVLESDLV